MEAANGKTQQQTTAIAPAPAQAPVIRPATPLAPDNLNDAWRLSEALARSTIIPKAYQGNPGNILAAIMLAQELRVTPMLIMREVFFLNDRPALYAELKIALVMREPECEYLTCTHTDAKSATFETKRRGHPKPTVITVKIEDIPEALRRKDTWQSWTANMLRWRCGGWICDLVYPDKVLGLKTKEEMEDAAELQAVHGTLQRLPTDIQAPAPLVQETTTEATKPAETGAGEATTKAEEKKDEPSAPDDAAAREAEVKISLVFTSAKSRAELKQAVSLIANHPDPARKKHWGDQYNLKSKELAA